jgi:O-antigen/teichoic acid export membrane protein
MVALTVARLASVAATFLAGVVAARLLTPAEVGVAGVGLTAGWAVAIAANGGLNIAAVIHLGERAEPRETIVRRFIGYLLGSLAVAVALTAVVGPLVGAFVLRSQQPWLFVGAAVLAGATIGYELTGALLLGLERRRAYVVTDLLRSGATLGLTALVLLWLSRSASGYVLATGLGVVVPAAFAVYLLRRATGSLRPLLEASHAKRTLRLGLSGQVGNVLTFLNLRLDLLLVPAFVTLDQAGIYFVTTRVAEVVGQASTAASSMLFPHVAAQGDRSSTATTERTSRLTLLATLVAGGVLAALGSFILGLFFGPVYRAGALTLLILLVGMVPLALSRVLAADLKGRGRPGLVSIGTGIGAVVTVVADVILIPLWGIRGAAVASVLAYAVSAGVLAVQYRRVSGGRFSRLLPRPSDVVDLVRMARARVGRR